MAQTNYYLGKTTNSAGESEINLRLYVSRDIRLRVGSGIWIDRKRWGKKNDINIPLIPGEEREELLKTKAKLKSLTDILEDLINTSDDKSAIDRVYMEKQIKKFHKPTKKKETIVEKTIFSTMETYLSVRKLSVPRVNNFKVMMRCLHRFELYKRKEDKNRGFRLSFNSLTPTVLKEIEDFLGMEQQIFLKYPEIYDEFSSSSRVAEKTSTRKRPPVLDKNGNVVPKGMPKQRGQNSVKDLLSRFRGFLGWAVDEEHIAKNPFDKYTVGEPVYGRPIYITIEERNKLLNTDMSDDPVLETQRDIFIFHCFVGCRVGNLLPMTYRNVIDGGIEYIGRKGKDKEVSVVRVPLNDTAKKLLAKYHDPDRDSLFPFYSEQKYNQRIKEAFKRAGLDRMVTVIDQVTRLEIQKPLYEVASSHMARRTFIGNIYKQVKDQNLVGILSGHKEGSKAFARYRDIDEDMKKELINLLS